MIRIPLKIFLRQERDYEFDEWSESGYQTPNGQYSLVLSTKSVERVFTLSREELVKLLFEGHVIEAELEFDMGELTEC